MSAFKLLIDTNVVIGLEDPQPVSNSLAELVRLSSEFDVALFVDGANYDDVARDKNVDRRRITRSKLDKFRRLRDFPQPPESVLASRFGPIKNEHDRSDVRLLSALDAKAVDFLVSQDGGIGRRAERAGLSGVVLTVEEALEWLRQSFQKKPVTLPYVVDRKAYEIDPSDALFDSLREDYRGFDKWFDEKCRLGHRDCWILEVGNQIAGIAIRKDEAPSDAPTKHRGPKILKICTLKVRDEYLGEKFGELLLKQIVWYAQKNHYDVVYLTVFPKHAFLIDLLKYYGFELTVSLTNGEVVLEKPLLHGATPSTVENPFEFDRVNYPRFYDGADVRKFVVPIQPAYHARLFPEIAIPIELPLFPLTEFGPLLDVDPSHGRTPGNTIRKVYLCRAKSTALQPGSVLLFYMSKDAKYVASQTITTVGILEQVSEATSTDDLLRMTAKRSVFSAEELAGQNAAPESPVKVLDFLLMGHVDPPIRLDVALQRGVFTNRPPQSIATLSAERYESVRPLLTLDF